jgi:hypothetical protein
MFQRLRHSWTKGLLSDTITRWLLVGQGVLFLSITVATFSRMNSFDGALPLRFATSEGYYDEGAWYRPLLLILFAAVVSIITVALSSSLFTQKDRELARGIIVCSLVVLLIALQISLNFIIPGQV